MVPMIGNQSTLVKIPRNGEHSKCGNWRGVTLPSYPVSSEIFTRVILNGVGYLLKEDKGRIEETITKGPDPRYLKNHRGEGVWVSEEVR